MTWNRGILLAALGAILSAGSAFAAEPARQPLVVGACKGCHGQAGEGVGSIPKITGYGKADLVAILQAFRKDERRPSTIMNRIAKGYTDADYEALADWYGKK